MMTLDDLIDYVMTESGQFIVGDLETTQIDRHRFHLIVKRALALYGRYKPQTQRLNVIIDRSVDLSLGVDRTPDWISRVVPIGTGGTDGKTGLSAAAFVYGNTMGGGGLTDSVYSRPRTRSMPWEYNAPVLSVYGPEDLYDVTAHYQPALADIQRDANNKVTDATVPGIDYRDEHFLDLLVGFFLIALGRSRRAFTLNDLPVTMDGDQMVSEGDEKLRTAREALQEQASWELALGE